jgi:hypothetical protein
VQYLPRDPHRQLDDFRLHPGEVTFALARKILQGLREGLALSRQFALKPRASLRFTFPEGDYAVVGKFFSAYPPQVSPDLSLAREYDNYLQLPGLGLGNGGGQVPRLLGRWPQRSLGLLLEAVPGPDLDRLLLQACVQGESAPLFRGLEKLAHLLAFFHSRPVPALPVSPEPALAYLDKVTAQLLEAGQLTREDWQTLAHERDAWDERFNYENWLKAFDKAGLDPSFYAHRQRPLEEVMPWAHIYVGVSTNFLKREYQYTFQGRETADCKLRCSACGLEKRLSLCRGKHAGRS